jgi:hypothetical protein
VFVCSYVSFLTALRSNPATSAHGDEGKGSTGERKSSKAGTSQSHERAQPSSTFGWITELPGTSPAAFVQGVEEGVVRAAELSDGPEAILRQFCRVEPRFTRLVRGVRNSTRSHTFGKLGNRRGEGK